LLNLPEFANFQADVQGFDALIKVMGQRDRLRIKVDLSVFREVAKYI
jgi:hypothetical protein